MNIGVSKSQRPGKIKGDIEWQWVRICLQQIRPLDPFALPFAMRQDRHQGMGHSKASPFPPRCFLLI